MQVDAISETKPTAQNNYVEPGVLYTMTYKPVETDELCYEIAASDFILTMAWP
jgi:hypothetical protein